MCLVLAPAAYSQQRAPAPAGGSANAGTPAEDSLPIAEGAAPARPGGVAAAPAPLVSAWDFLRMVLVLAVVVGLIYGLFHLLKRGQGRRVIENQRIRLIGSRTLSGNRSLHLVQVGASIFLVGSAEGGVTLISELKDKETIDQVRLEDAREATPSARSFASVLAGLFRPAGRDSRGADLLPGASPTVDYIKKQQERLKRM